MVVGLCQVELRLQGVQSLKGKRSVVKKLIERTRARFPVSIAETAHHDDLRRGGVGFSAVGSDVRLIESRMDCIVEFMRELYVAEILSARREVFCWSGEWGEEPWMSMADMESAQTLAERDED